MNTVKLGTRVKCRCCDSKGKVVRYDDDTVTFLMSNGNELDILWDYCEVLPPNHSIKTWNKPYVK